MKVPRIDLSAPPYIRNMINRERDPMRANTAERSVMTLSIIARPIVPRLPFVSIPITQHSDYALIKRTRVD